MRRADRIRSHSLQDIHAITLKPVGQRRAHSGVVLMIAGSLELDGLTIQKKTFARIPCDGAHAEHNALGIANFAARFDGHYHRVEIRRLGRPQGWIK